MRTPNEVVRSAAVMLGRIESQRGNVAAAERILREAVDRVPNDPVGRFFLGELLRRRGDLEGAVRQLQAARVAPIRNSNLPLPVAGLARAIRLQLGEIVEILGQPAEAAALYREALRDRSEDRPLRRALARSLTQAFAFDDAEAILDELGTSGEDAGEIRLLRASLAFLRGRDEEAMARFREVLEAVPHAWAAHLHLGHLTLRNGDPAGARRHYERAVALADNPETRVGLAAAQLESGLLRECLDSLAEAVEKCQGRPLPPGTEALSGEALLRLGLPDQARGAFEKHLKRHGPDARVLARLADCYRTLGVQSAARLGYEEALKLDPHLLEARKGLEALAAVP